jgi:Divergent InlB B-repeat domain
VVPNTQRKALWLGLAVAAIAAVTATGALGALNDSATAQARTVTDMPDDISGPQVHFLYIVPSGGADAQLDTNGGMEQSIARIERWFVTHAENQGLRVDTYNGAPDITFVRLPHSDAQATASNPWPLWVIGEDLVAAGFNDQAKVYAAFYDGHSTWACGGAYSPALRKLGAIYLQAHPTNDPRPCRDAPGFGTGTDRPGYFEIGLLHEIMHVIGFSPTCAPHASASAFPDHVNDSPTDLMYGPDATHTAYWNWANAVLDFNHDDYYRANVPGCYDLSENPYLEQIPSFNLTVTIRGHGSVDTLIGTTTPKSCRTVCTFSALRGSVITLLATPAAGSRLVAWSGDCSGKSGCQLTMTGPTSVTATFSAKPKPKCRKGQKSTKKHPCVKK